MQKVIIFGASSGGKNFIKNQNQYEIIAVTDNNSEKWGTFLEGIEVVQPSNIFKYDFEKIVVTSLFFYPIQKQLVNELQVDPTKIVAPPKNLLKEVMYPFEDAKTVAFANKTLLKLCEMLEINNVPYFLNFGTLLGIVRDNKLISWDDDIDIACYLDDWGILEVILDKFVQQHSTAELQWDYSAIKITGESEKSSVVLSFVSSMKALLKFSIGISLIHFQEGFAIQTMNKCDKAHFLNYEIIEYKGEQLRVPYKYKEYLKHTYGDWQTPKKEVTFAEYTNCYIKD